MFEHFLKQAFAEVIKEIEDKKKHETNQLMEEIDSFHKQNAIDKALEIGDEASFLSLTGGTNHVHQ